MYKNYFKLAVSFVLAITVVFLGISPSTSSAEEIHDYTDVDQENSHYDGVQWLSQKGIIGYPDGSFGVGKELTRPHTAIMFTNVLDLDLLNPEDVSTYFDDVDSSVEYAEYIATVGAEGIFKGSDGNFLPEKGLTREQMASTIVNAYGLKDNGADVKINLDNVTPTHQESVQILANYNITNQLDDFRPNEVITRGQFATFLKLADQVNLPKEVSTVDDIHINMGASLDELDMPKTMAVTFEDDSVQDLAVDWDVSNLDLSTPGKYEINGDVEGISLKANVTIVVDKVEIEKLEDITVFSGMKIENLPLSEEVAVTFADGTVEDLAVDWDVTDLDLDTPGEYKVVGDIADINLTANISIIVQTEYPSDVSVTYADITLKEEDTFKVDATITPKDAVKKSLTWTSSDDSIAVVDDDGLITGISEGEAIVTVTTENGLEDSVTVTVSNRPSLNTNTYGNVVINGVIQGVSMGIRNMDTDTVTIDKIEIYEKDKLKTTYTQADLEDNGIGSEILSGNKWGMSISYKFGGLWEDKSHVIYYIKSNDSTYEFRDDL